MNDWAEFRHFKYLLAIVEHKGFRAAAEQLHTAQPNLSAQAKQFQDLSAIHLFRKGKDGRIRLTETGVAFKPIAQGLLDARDEAIAALVAIERGEIRTLKFGCTSLVDQALFHTCCQMHRDILPTSPILPAHGDSLQLLEEIAEGEIDVAVDVLPVNDPRLCVEVIRRDRLVVCLRRDHELAKKMVLQPADLKGNLTILYHPQRHRHAYQRHRSFHSPSLSCREAGKVVLQTKLNRGCARFRASSCCPHICKRGTCSRHDGFLRCADPYGDVQNLHHEGRFPTRPETFRRG
jgi:DNA-binding transcriptional LysR family regulator